MAKTKPSWLSEPFLICFNYQENSVNHFLWLKIMRVQTFFIFSASVSWKITFFGTIYDHFFVSCCLILFVHSFSCNHKDECFHPRWRLEEGLYSSHKYMKRNMQGFFINANIRAVGLVIRATREINGGHTLAWVEVIACVCGNNKVIISELIAFLSANCNFEHDQIASDGHFQLPPQDWKQREVYILQRSPSMNSGVYWQRIFHKH